MEICNLTHPRKLDAKEEIECEMRSLANSHPEAVRTSFDGVQFNCFGDEWRLSLTVHCKLEHIYETNFGLNEHIKLRLVLADVAVTKSTQVAREVVNFVSGGKLSSLTVKAVKKSVAQGRSENKSDVRLRQLKTFIIALQKRFTEYDELLDEVRSYKVHNSKPNVYDADKGALTEFEYHSLKQRLDQLSHEITARIEMGGLSYGALIVYRSLIIMRLLIITSRRPSQLSMLKWCDLQIGMTSILDEFAIAIPSAKKFNARGFRHSFEGMAIPLNEEFSRELFGFKAASFKYLKNIFSKACRDFCPEKFAQVFDFFPLIPHAGLLTSSRSQRIELPESFEELIQLLGPKSSTFHTEGSGSITGSFSMLDEITSDRGVNVNKSAGSRRFRHTVGSMLALKGFDILTISNSLGVTPKAAKYYIDLMPESRRQIDEKVKDLRSLAKRFIGHVVTRVEQNNAIYDESGFVCGGVENASACLICTDARPIGCYGCENFRPLASANHQEVLKQVKKIHDNWLEAGADGVVLAPIRNKIKSIEATIIACEREMTKLSQGGEM